MFVPRSSNYKNKVEHSFARQEITQTLNMKIDDIAPGQVILSMPYIKAYTQQHGFLHAGIIATGLDNACGYAAFSLMADEASVLTVEFKTNLLAPAKGQTFQFTAKVKKAGRTLTFVEAEAHAITGNNRKLIATMSATMMAIINRDDVQE